MYGEKREGVTCSNSHTLKLHPGHCWGLRAPHMGHLLFEGRHQGTQAKTFL